MVVKLTNPLSSVTLILTVSPSRIKYIAPCSVDNSGFKGTAPMLTWITPVPFIFAIESLYELAMVSLLYQWQYNDFNGGNKKGLFCRFAL
jgi:hypothetical protein